MAKEILRSRPFTWSPNARIPIDLSFLEAALSKYRSPVLESIVLRAYGTIVTSGAVTWENFDQCAAVCSNFLWRDKRGERINLTGREIRIAAQMEQGARFVDPSDQLGTTTNTAFELNLPITFHPQRSRRRADFRPGVAEMVSGEVIWTAAPTNPITASTIINGLTLELHAVVTDEVVREAASRMCWLGVNAPLAEDYYMIDGAARYAFMYAYNSGSDLTSLATYTEVDSTTLDLVDVPRSALQQQYQLETMSLDATNDEVTRNRVIPLIWPNLDQKTTGLRDINKLHVRLQGALPTGGRIVYCTITDRDPTMTAVSLGLPPAEAAATVKRVPTPKGSKATGTVPLSVTRKLPIRVG